MLLYLKPVLLEIKMNYNIVIGSRTRYYLRNRIDKKRLTDTDFSIITNHCMGGIIYHDLGLPFLSPTINLKILPDDFIIFIENLEEYLSLPIIEVEDDSVSYPVARINGSCGPVTIWFVHYNSFDEAATIWNKRKERVIFDNIRVMMTIRDGCTQDTIDRFSALRYENKVMFANEPHPECECAVYSHLPNGKPLPGYISDIINIWGKRAYECGFDYIRFLNGKSNERI